MKLKINKWREINKPKTGSLTIAKPLAKLPKSKIQKAPIRPLL